MNISEAVSFSLQALRANRLRTFLTALGMIIGNASVILVVTISLASKDLILDLIRGVGSNLIIANSDASAQNAAKVQGDYIKFADVQALRTQLGSQIVAASSVMPTHDQIVVNGQVREVGVAGVDEQYALVRNIITIAGRHFDPSDIELRQRVAMLTDKLAVRLFGGQEAAIGQTVRLSRLQFTVVGTFREKTSTFGNSEIGEETILIPISLMKYFVDFERIDPVYLQARMAAEVPTVRGEVANILETRHRAGAKFTVQDLSAMLDTANQVASVLTLVLIIVSAIALVISGIGIMNIMLVTVTERTREIGLRMAVGASRREVLLQFLVESVLISLLGGIIGIAVGLAIPLGAQPFVAPFRIPVNPVSALVAFAVSFAVGVGFGLLPARRASQLNPTEALRYE